MRLAAHRPSRCSSRPARGAAGRAAVLGHARATTSGSTASSRWASCCYRRGGPDVVRPGGLRRARRVHVGVPHDAVRRVAVAHARDRPRDHRAGRAVPRLHHAAHEGPLPAARHDRVGHQPLLRVRQPRDAGRAHRHDRHSRAVARRLRAQGRAPLFLPHLGDHARGAVGDPQPARLAAGPRDPRAEGRARHGGGLRRRRRAPEDRRVRLRRAARVHFRLAVRAPAAVRESDAVRHQPGHRVSVHGRGRRRRQRVGRGARRDADHAAEASAAGPACPGLLGRQGNFELVVFGILMVLLLQFAREGVWPWIARMLPKRASAAGPRRGAAAGARASAGSGRAACASATRASSSAASSRSTIFRSRSARARSSGSSDRTAPARARRSR